MIISTACSAIAAAALYRLGGPWAAVAWLFAPTAVFTVVPYTESLFCAAAFWAWETSPLRSLAGRRRAHRRSPARVRVSGLFLIGALLVMIITDRKPAAVKLRRAALMLIPASVIMAFATYLYVLTGSWTAWYRAQTTGWVRQLTWPWESFLNTIPAILPGAYANHPWWAAVFRGEMISMAVGVGVTIWCIAVSLRARRPPNGTGPGRCGGRPAGSACRYWRSPCRTGSSRSTAPPCSGSRCGSCSVAGSRGLAGFLRPLHRLLVAAAFAVEIVLMLWWSWLFFTGHWAS